MTSPKFSRSALMKLFVLVLLLVACRLVDEVRPGADPTPTAELVEEEATDTPEPTETPELEATRESSATPESAADLVGFESTESGYRIGYPEA